MKYPNLNEEKKLWRKRYKWVAGLDEAGRGPLAGPVVAAAVVLKLEPLRCNSAKLNRNLDLIAGRPQADSPKGCNLKLKIKNFGGIKDSKQLSNKKRQELYKNIINSPDICWGVGIVSEKVIDKINILNATKLAMTKAIDNLVVKSKYQNPNVKTNQKFKKTKKAASQILDDRPKSAMLKSVDFLILDGNMKLNINIPQKAIIRADEKVFSCAAASILAKVTRDRMMDKYDKKYPRYEFKKHKGYPTASHFSKLKKYGPCKIHRKSFSWG